MSVRRRPRIRVSALMLLAALGMAGCVSTTTQTQTVADASSSAPPPTDEASIKRRAGVRLELASLYFARGQAETALKEIDEALKIRPDYGQAYNLRGLIYANLGDNGRAESSFQRALQIDPQDADAMHNYAWFLCQSQHYAAAEELFQKALIQPNYRGTAMTLRAMGNCQARDNRLAEAEKSLMRSYEIDPSSAATAVNLADVLYRRGDYERARFYIDRVNKVPQQVNAQSLWLAARIENRMGNATAVRVLGNKLVEQFPQSTEALAYAQGRFND